MSPRRSSTGGGWIHVDAARPAGAGRTAVERHSDLLHTCRSAVSAPRPVSDESVASHSLPPNRARPLAHQTPCCTRGQGSERGASRGEVRMAANSEGITQMPVVLRPLAREHPMGFDKASVAGTVPSAASVRSANGSLSNPRRHQSAVSLRHKMLDGVVKPRAAGGTSGVYVPRLTCAIARRHSVMRSAARSRLIEGWKLASTFHSALISSMPAYTPAYKPAR